MKKETGTRSRKGTLITVIIIAVVAVAFAARFISLRDQGTVASIDSVQKKEGKPVELVKVERGEINRWITLAGTVEGLNQYPIISTNTIQIKDVLKSEGSLVEPGDVIIRLIKEAPNPMLHSYKRARAVYEDAGKDLQRMKNLYREGAVSKQALDKAELNFSVAGTNLINASEGINLKTSTRGIVTSILVEEGEMANAGAPLAWIANTDTVKIVFHAGSRQALDLDIGQAAVWKSELTGKSGRGRISKLAVSADPRTHLLEGEALFPNQEGELVPGLLVSFDVNVANNSGALTIPNESMIKTDGTYRVFVAEETEQGYRAEQRIIETGVRTTDRTEVTSGLSAGEMVVKFGWSKLQDGDLIKPVKGGN
ncbi:MAG: efflux RND transporter periplasmic adaptor subunit [Candidatus Krumholzibacteriales bacterium]